MDQHSFPYHNPFNLIALLIALIRNNFRDEYDDVAKRESKVLNEEEWKWADGFFKSLYSHYSVDFLLDTGIPGEYVCELQEHLRIAVDKYSCVMYVLVRICKDFSCDKILESKYVKNRPSGFVSLNDNVKETHILVEPKVSSIANPDNHSSVSGMGGVKSDIKYKWNDDRYIIDLPFVFIWENVV